MKIENRKTPWGKGRNHVVWLEPTKAVFQPGEHHEYITIFSSTLTSTLTSCEDARCKSNLYPVSGTRKKEKIRPFRGSNPGGAIGENKRAPYKTRMVM